MTGLHKTATLGGICKIHRDYLEGTQSSIPSWTPTAHSTKIFSSTRWEKCHSAHWDRKASSQRNWCFSSPSAYKSMVQFVLNTIFRKTAGVSLFKSSHAIHDRSYRHFRYLNKVHSEQLENKNKIQTHNQSLASLTFFCSDDFCVQVESRSTFQALHRSPVTRKIFKFSKLLACFKNTTSLK